MDTKKRRYLNEIKECREKICYAKERKGDMRLNYTDLTGIDYSRERIQVSPTNRIELMAWRLLEACEIYNNMIYYYMTELDARLRAISEVGEPYAGVLMKRFSEEMTYDEIAYDMKKSVSWVKKTCALGVDTVYVKNEVLHFEWPEEDQNVEFMEEDY